MRSLLVTSLALLFGCAPVLQDRQTRTLSLSLGSPRAACQGGEKSVKLDQTIQLERRLGAGGEGCVLDLYWEGALVDTAQLGVRLPDDSVSLARVSVRFQKLDLVDEVGQAIDLALPELRFTLHYGDVELLTVSGKATRGPWGRGLKVELPAAARARVAKMLRQQQSVRGKAHLRVVLDEASRRGLQRRAQGPLFELLYQWKLVLEPRAKAGATSQPTSPRPSPKASPTAQPASAPVGALP